MVSGDAVTALGSTLNINTVDVDGVITFLPGRQVDMKPVKDISHLIEQKLSFKVLKIDRERGNIVISRKAFLEENFKENIADNKNNLKDGKSVEGIIKNITDYGAFVDLGTTDGLIHLTDISWKKVKHPSESLSLAQNLTVKVIGLDREKLRETLKYSIPLIPIALAGWLYSMIDKIFLNNLISTASAGLNTYKLGIALNEDKCSTGWWVGPSSPRPTESCVIT